MRLVMMIHGDGGSLPDNDAWAAAAAVLSLLYLGPALPRGRRAGINGRQESCIGALARGG